MRNILILFSIVFLVSCASTSKKADNAATETTETAKTEVKTTTPTIDDTEIHWMSFEEAVSRQKDNPKKIFMDAYTKWCGPCKMLDKNTFHNSDVVKYVNEHYYAVKFDAEGKDPINFKGKAYKNPKYVEGKRGRNGVHELTRFLGVNAYPTMIFMDENADMIMPVKGYLKPKQLELYLKLVGQDDFKAIKTDQDWQNYQRNFKPTF